MSLAVPLFVHPAVNPELWRVIEEHADETDWVVVNAADGPGSLVDGVLLAAIARIQAVGVSVLGYVNCAYGRRAPSELLDDQLRWRSWYDVNGIFVDQVPADRPQWVQQAVRQLRGAGATRIVGNPGNPIDHDSAAEFDAVVVFEGMIESHRAQARPTEVRSGLQPSTAHLIYGVPPGRVGETVQRAHSAGASAIWITASVGENPYQGVPEYLAEVIERARAIN